MLIFEADAPQELYRPQLRALLADGHDIKVRNHATGEPIASKELLDVATVIRQPRRRVHIIPGRRASPFIALSESLWLLAGRNDVAALAPYNQRIHQYSDDGYTLYDAYGFRIKDQLMPLVERLRADPSDRRAVLTIWRPDDLTADTKSPPCNDLVAFKLREGRLHMTVFCRSNDIHWGLYAVNLCQFSILLEYLAARLGVEMGTQTHISNSLHVYIEGPAAKVTERMLAAWDEPLPELPEPRPLFSELPSHAQFVYECSVALNGDNLPIAVPFLAFAREYLGCYRKQSNPNDCFYATEWPDWVLAGERFMGGPYGL